MPIFFRTRRQQHRIVVRATPDATVADLARLLGEGQCAVDGCVADPALPLADWQVLRGAEVTIDDCRGIGDDRPAPPAAPERLAVVGGLDAGPSIPLPRGVDVIVGRHPGADLVVHDETVSERHVRVGDSGIEDLGSTNGTRVDGARLHLGATTVERRNASTGPTVPLPDPAPVDGVAVPGGWALAFHRPPPELPPPAMPPVLLPAAPAPSAGATPIGVVALLAPLLLGGVMVVVLHDLLWGLFALLGPVMAAGTWWDQRRRGARLGRHVAHRRARRIAACAAALDAARTVERARRLRVHPDLPAVADQVSGPGVQLWGRRPGDPHFLQVRIGTGDISWRPPLANAEVLVHPDDEHHDGSVARLVAEASTLADAPAVVSLAPGTMVGLVGDRRTARAVARALLVRAATAHGPADLGVRVLATPGAEDDWRWTDWLPHASQVPGASLVVVDGPELWTGSDPSVRRMLADPDERLGFLLLADRTERVPAGATTVVELLDRHGTGRLSGRDATDTSGAVRLEGCGVGWATSVSRGLARLSDPEADGGTGRLPDAVRLLDPWHPDHELLRGDAEQLAARWSLDPDPPPRATIGVGSHGPAALDLATDGPHVLVAGTTGAGKSELLRTLLIGLAAGAPPAAMNFVLIDFKGGSAFDRLAELPHTVGVVTDLSPEEARRTLRALEAELRARERVLRASGAVDLEDHRARGGADVRQLSRLVVAVDEFATLAREQPESLDALLSIAQRGRSLGIHLVLATQRPAGIVGEALRANLSARIALRLPREADSADVLGAPDAAHLPRTVPGRAILALGADARRTVQVATTATARRTGSAPRVELIADPPLGHLQVDAPEAQTDGTDLDALVELLVAAHARSEAPEPRPVCLPALPAHLGLAQLPDGAFGLLDDPDDQTRRPLVWRHAEGPLLVVGGPRSGRSTALLAAVASAARTVDPDQLHVYAIDGARRGIAALGDLAHTGGVVGPGDAMRHHRLVTQLRAELQRRRTPDSATAHRIVLCVDDLGSLLVGWDDEVVDGFGELVTTGAAFGISVAMSVDRLGALRAAWQASIVQRLALRSDGRAIAWPEELVAQVAWPEVAADRRTRSAPPIRLLPDEVPAGDLRAATTPDGWWLPLGIADDTLATIGWTLRDDDHVLITGPPGSGRSTTMRALAAIVDAAADTDLVTVEGRAQPRGAEEPWDRALIAAADVTARFAARGERRLVVLVDDADRLPDDGHGLRDLVTAGTAGVHLVVATTGEQARRGFAHLNREVRTRGLGLLLMPDHDLDGELFGVRLPRRAPLGMRPGRGYLVAGGRSRLAQAACVKAIETH